jgi:hypothetical protein
VLILPPGSGIRIWDIFFLDPRSGSEINFLFDYRS